MLKKFAPFLTLMLAITLTLQAQVTTSSISGTIRTSKGEALTGATITATHTPTGTIYRVTSRTGGRFDLYNLNPGGPYTITVSFVGFNEEKKEDVFLNLGEISTQNFNLVDKNSVLTEVVVAGRRSGSSGKAGGETNIGRDKMANLPTVGRNLADYLRFTPQVKITSLGGFSFAGQNNRYNSFMIDGAVNNDVFGLSDQGTNGGRAGAPPISIDAIDQISVQLSPYDVSLGNFTGGGINAITRAGTNTTTGSVYYVYRNQDLAGRNPLPVLKPGTLSTYERPKLTSFENKTFGFRVGGPIIKNKLFYFLNLEHQDDSRPQPFDPATYQGNYIKNDSLNTLINYLKSNYQYDPGDYINNPDLIKADRLASRFDWNINEKNQLTVSYRYTKLERTNPGRSSTNTINFFNNAEHFPSTTHSGSAELNSKFTNSSNNKLRLTFTNVVDDRGPAGSPFPGVTIRDGSNSINFGTEAASAANLLKQSIFNFFDAFKIISRNNTITIGADIDYNKTYNLFINRNYGLYEYTNMSDFLKGNRPLRLRRGYSLVDGNKSGDDAVNSAAQFNSIRAGFFLSDDIKLNDNVTLTLGIRADKTEFLNTPAVDPFFRDSAAPIIAKSYDLKGAETGKMFKPRWALSPRIGIRYNMPDENITFRGGIGIMTGRSLLVWPGGGFQNTGVTIGAFDVSNPNLVFRSDVNNQYTATDLGLSRITPQGELNLVARNFKVPQILRSSMAVDKRFGNGWTLTTEFVFTKNLVEVDWQNLVFDPTTVKQITGPDRRNAYDPLLVAQNSTTRNGIKIPLRPYLPLSDIGRSPYTSIILIKNTDGQKGYSYNFTVTLDKSFRNGFSLNLNYAYGSSVVRNEGTSSINSSNWNNMEAVNGRNYIPLTLSDFDLGHRITAYVAKKFTYANKMLATTISLDYTGQSGSPISYTMTNNINGDGNNFNDLMYIPTSDEINSMVFLSNTFQGINYSQQQQRDMFNTYIQNDNYLSKHRGQFAERNASRLPFTHVVNLKIAQDISLRVAKHTYSFQVSYDVFNFTNMINKDWGRQYFANFDQVQVLQFAGYQANSTIPTYRFSPVTTPWGKPYTLSDGISPYNSSRWTSQVTVRFNF